MSDMEQLKQRIAALEAKLGKKADEDEDDDDAKLASEIKALEGRLAEDEDDEKVEKVEKKASEVDPSGVEEKITQDRFSEVERIQHGEELTTGPSMGAVAPTRSEYVTRMKSASARLDKVADYLEKHGRRELAFRIDKIADAIDVRIKGGK